MMNIGTKAQIIKWDDKYWNKGTNNPMIINNSPTHGINSSPRICDDFVSIIQNYDKDEKNSFIIEEECYFDFVTGQPDNLFTFPNSEDVSNDPMFYNSDISIDNEPNVKNTVLLLIKIILQFLTEVMMQILYHYQKV